ncbi:MAG: response regulator [Deltaproteobacteria bacterium]|nr:response regulator [Deltaproteobacteria bacterium]
MLKKKKEKILFVDDKKGILDIANEYFRQKGYQVVTAKNGLEAVKILSDENIDCCFTDINMPEMDGLELAEHIRETDNTIPVIIMTGYPSIENTIKTLKNGVVDFLIKPINLNQIEVCLKRVLRERQLFIENILLKKEVEGKEQLERLNRELLYKVEELNILNKIMSDFTITSSSSDVFKRLVDTTIKVIHADEARFYVINEAVKRPFNVTAAISIPNKTKSSAGTDKAIEKLIMETVSDEIPLLISENKGSKGLPEDILSFMVVPLAIREKVFGVLTACIKKSSILFTEKDLYYLSFMTNKAAYAIENLALYENIYENLFSTLYAFVKAIEARDPYTQQHSNRVTSISIVIGKEMGCTSEELDILNFAGHLHDIGKIGIRDAILLKQGTYTEEERNIIKEHPIIGASIIGQLWLLDSEKQIIKHHHERFDGTGYPDGLKNKEIPLLARILSVADVYDAIASDRAYRKKMEKNEIIKIIKEGSGTQFDPDVVDAFFKLYHAGVIEKII